MKKSFYSLLIGAAAVVLGGAIAIGQTFNGEVTVDPGQQVANWTPAAPVAPTATYEAATGVSLTVYAPTTGSYINNEVPVTGDLPTGFTMNLKVYRAEAADGEGTLVGTSDAIAASAAYTLTDNYEFEAGKTYYYYATATNGADDTKVSERGAAASVEIPAPAGALTVPYSVETKKGNVDDWTINAAWTAGKSSCYVGYNGSYPEVYSWLVSPAIALEAGKKYKVTYNLSTKGDTYNCDVAVATENTNSALETGTTLFSNDEYKTDTLPVDLVCDVFTPTATGNYYFGFGIYDVKKSFYVYIYNFSVVEIGGGEPVYTDLYLRGAINGWNATDEYKFNTEDGNIYTLANVTIPANSEFKIADADWSEGYNFGGARDVKVGGEYKLESDGNCSTPLFEGFTGDLAFNVETKTLTVTGTADAVEALYVIGTPNGWDINASDYKLEKNETGFQYTGEFPAADNGLMFTFYSELGNWEANYYGPQTDVEGNDVVCTLTDGVYTGQLAAVKKNFFFQEITTAQNVEITVALDGTVSIKLSEQAPEDNSIYIHFYDNDNRVKLQLNEYSGLYECYDVECPADPLGLTFRFENTDGTVAYGPAVKFSTPELDEESGENCYIDYSVVKVEGTKEQVDETGYWYSFPAVTTESTANFAFVYDERFGVGAMMIQFTSGMPATPEYYPAEAELATAYNASKKEATVTVTLPTQFNVYTTSTYSVVDIDGTGTLTKAVLYRVEATDIFNAQSTEIYTWDGNLTPGEELKYVDAYDFDAEKTYYYQVRVYGEVEGVENYTETLRVALNMDSEFTPLPATNIQATREDLTVTITWDAPAVDASKIKGYYIYVNGEKQNFMAFTVRKFDYEIPEGTTGDVTLDIYIETEYTDGQTCNSEVLNYMTTSVLELLMESEGVDVYNLQGVRVKNPESGLYIIRRNGKAQRVYVTK